MKSKVFKSVILIALVCLSMGAFAQANDARVPEPEYDYVNITFGNMGNLSTNGTISVKWLHNDNPSYWRYCTFPYNYQNCQGTHQYNDFSEWVTRNYLDVVVTVSLGTLSTAVSATKHWDGTLNFIFTASDFVHSQGPGASTE